MTGLDNPTGEDIPKRRTNGHAKRLWGETGRKPRTDMAVKWRHLIRRPAKLTGPRHELCTWGEPARPGVGSLSRKRHTQYVEHNRKGHCGAKQK
jgi:hypothetical protein